MHHPFYWLTETDNMNAKRLLEKRADFILSGHIHRIDDVGKMSIFGNAFNISSGSIYTGEDTLSNTGGGYWSNDNQIDKTIQDGIVTFRLPSRIPIKNTDAQFSLRPTLKNQIDELKSIADEPLPRIPKSLLQDISDGKCVRGRRHIN